MADPAAEAAVIDASPLLHLARSGSLSLLAVLGPQWVIPAEVADEVRAKEETDRTVQAIEAWAGFILPPPLEIPTKIKSRQLGRGESAVLFWALAHPGSVLFYEFKAHPSVCIQSSRFSERGGPREEPRRSLAMR